MPAGLLDTSDTGIIHFRPLFAPGNSEQPVDLHYLRLNPTAQRLLRLPEFPTNTFLTLNPGDTATFEFYRDAFLADKVRIRPLAYPGGWRARAQRHGPQLVVSLTATDAPAAEPAGPALATQRAASEAALGRAQLAAQQLTQERDALRRILAQTPAAICVLRGPEYQFDYVNPAFARLFAQRALLGRPAAEVLPEALNQGFITLLDRVYDTGETYLETELPLASPSGGDPHYFNFTYQAHLENGHADRLSVFAYDVTEQALARRQVQQLNGELLATNDELRTKVDELASAQQQLLHLNQELENRVAAGVQEARQAHTAAEGQRQRLLRFFEQAPAAVCVLDGPELVYELVNPVYQQYFLGRALLGQPVQAVPEFAEQNIPAILRQVYDTGITHEGHEVRLRLHPAGGPPQEVYFNCVYQARYDEQGQVDGVLVFAHDVSEQVRARQQAQQLSAELEARVAERTQQLQQLNDELETRVAERTQQLQAALHEAERQRGYLHEQQGLLRQILGQLPAAVATLAGPEHRFVFFNDSYQALAGGRARLGQTVADLFPALTAEGFGQVLDEVYTTGQLYRGHRQSGALYAPVAGPAAPRYVDFQYQPLKNAHDQPQGILVFIVDVTEQVLAQQRAEALQAEVQAATRQQKPESQVLDQVFAQTPGALALLRAPDYQLAYFNPAFERLFPGRALQGLPVGQALPDVVAQDLVARLDEVRRTGQPHFATELPLTIAQFEDQLARVVYLDLTLQTYQEAGQPVGVSVLAFDVSEQVRARQQREAAHHQLHKVLEQAPVGLALLAGPTYRVEVASPLICALWGQPQAQVLGRPLLEVLPEAACPGLAALLAKVHRTGVAQVVPEHPCQRPGHSETGYFHFVYQPLRNAQGQVTAVAVVATDVSTRVASRQQLAKANEELRATNEQLTRTNATLDNFIYTAAQDLRAPIANLASLLGLLRQQLPTAPQPAGLVPRALNMMQGAVERCQLILAQLTGLAQQPPADLAAVAEAVRLDLAPQLEATGARFIVEPADDTAVPLTPRHLHAVVYNLLGHVLKHAQPDSSPIIQLRCYDEAGTTYLAVEADNVDSSEEAPPLPTPPDSPAPGFDTARRLVEDAGGTLTVRSQPGAGTTFTAAFPS